MKFGMIGAGTLSQAIASHPLKAGHDVIFSNSRGPDTLAELVERLGRGASAGTIADAGEADFVVLAVTWSRVREALDLLPSRPGRILIDATNQWAAPPPAAVPDVLDVGGSELVASLVPDTRVIKAFNNLFGPVIAADPVTPAGHRVLFHAGDDADAKSAFRAVAEDFGFAPVDLGPLRMGRLMQVDGPLTGLHAVREDVPHPVGLS
ncbi:NAD(P)-binding domain-containing protein [Amycolatopsis sp., V23-08]|uniref:NAD(P)-binding domain-containing protein n=1 Tax=Amycolatopsis heterodermiae TaxID=3110235 RepID=A0ABU5R9I2_9PSEU|nr:NAD(P)-binding domain-containing protein [Amycolatopsis sp., V23-08]MEA5362299.1 NAD(P)-binding domain-containing protein [Amycolatopsis sp., V23-08]